MNPKLITLQQQPELAAAMDELIEGIWPAFMLQDRSPTNTGAGCIRPSANVRWPLSTGIA